MPETVLEADLTWTGSRFEPGVRIAVGSDGRILAAGPLMAPPTERLARRALLPGFVNAHSHAFQRGLRGRGESFPAGAGSFWSWREAMYALANDLDEAEFFALCRQAFSEMRRAGITTVGEFHYLHHLGRMDFALDELVLAAAKDAGVRLVLLETYYRTGGIGQPLAEGQRRFEVPSLDPYWRQMDHLARALDPRTQSLGAVAHSIRAASPDEIVALSEEARRRGLVFHLHVEEQRQEIDACVAAYGARPMRILVDRIDVSHTTAVHCTHTDVRDLEPFVAHGGTVCLCPLTEGNLGDGIAGLEALRERAGAPALAALALGSDSNARISMLEEMRWLEYAQRLARERRGVLADERGEVATTLLQAATRGGARALGVPAGEIRTGAWADFVAIDLDAPTLAGVDASALPAALVFGCAEEVIAGTCVGGRW